MSERIENQYVPDFVSPPGETLLEIIEELGMTQAELAERMGRPRKTVNEIIQGKAAITAVTALQLERVLGTPAQFWANREQNYRQHLARVEEGKRLSDQMAWLRRFPVKAMSKLGWVRACDDKLEQLQELLKFFSIASPDQWESLWLSSKVSYRTTLAFRSDPEALSAWLRRGEIVAQGIECQAYDAKTFRQTLLTDVRPLTVEPPTVLQPRLVELCARAGVAVAFVPQLPRARVSGATRWLSPDKALIQLSLRYKSDDQLWFTLFHEAGHILLHGKREVFLEDDGMDGVKEREADEFATRALIPPNSLARFLQGVKPGYISKQAIRQFASEIGVAPGIVVGRLQHDGHLPPSHCNDLKRKLQWRD